MAGGSLKVCVILYFSLVIWSYVHTTKVEGFTYSVVNSIPNHGIYITFDTHHIQKRQTQASSPLNPIAATKDATTQFMEVKGEGNHKYYTSTILQVRKLEYPYWEELYNTEPHGELSNDHRIAVTQSMNSQFPFYGNLVDKITISTGGFLYMSPFLHQWLSRTQYIAPLMANFDTSLRNESKVIYKEFSDRLVVEWRAVFLQDQKHTNPFTFQTTLHKNGTIVFSYKKVPMSVMEIESVNHPVKIGVSDAYYIDTKTGGVTRRTIYEYQKIEVNTTLITENTVVILKPLKTCNTAKDCETCVTQTKEFSCKWCSKLKRCSDGFDRKRQEWNDNGCASSAISNGCSLNDKELLNKEESPKLNAEKEPKL